MKLLIFLLLISPICLAQKVEFLELSEDPPGLEVLDKSFTVTYKISKFIPPQCKKIESFSSQSKEPNTCYINLNFGKLEKDFPPPSIRIDDNVFITEVSYSRDNITGEVTVSILCHNEKLMNKLAKKLSKALKVELVEHKAK